MARKKQSEKVDLSDPEATVNLAANIGFTPVGDAETTNIQDMLPTFIPQWDYIMGGGIPFGRLTEIYAPEQVGKSTLMIYLNRVANALGAEVYWLDAEGTVEQDRMSNLGVDLRHSYIYSPKNNNGETLTVEKVGEEIEQIINAYNQDGLRDIPLLVIWDSIGGTVTQAEEDTDWGEEGQRGRSAAAITKLVRKITPMLKDVNIALVAINQVRANQNMMNKYDKKFVAGGGEALKHSDSLRLELVKSSQIKGKYKGDKDETYEGHLINMKIDKSKQSRPHQSAKAVLMAGWLMENGAYFDGIDFEYNMYQAAKDAGFITSGGAYKKYIDENGEEIYKAYEIDFLKHMKDDPEFTKDIFVRLVKAYYPHSHPRYLDNIHLNADNWPGVKELREYFKEHPDDQDKDTGLATE